MTEITKEQIELWRNFFSAHPQNTEVNKLCDLALRGLETQRKPIDLFAAHSLHLTTALGEPK